MASHSCHVLLSKAYMSLAFAACKHLFEYVLMLYPCECLVCLFGEHSECIGLILAAQEIDGTCLL